MSRSQERVREAFRHVGDAEPAACCLYQKIVVVQSQSARNIDRHLRTVS